MPQPLFADLLQYLRRTCAIQASRDLDDGELLRRFLAHRDQAAFAALVHRHGPMVLSLGKRLLGDAHLAEDVFQATFLVLVRRAASLRRHKPLAGWLYAVARRIALRARGDVANRRDKERRLTAMASTEPLDELTWQELRTVLDEEIGQLGDKHSAPVVLCYFQGLSLDQAAKELGCPKSTLARRLAKARDVLRQRLVKRSITLSAAALATALGDKAAAGPVGVMLTINTVKAAMSLAAGNAVAAGCLSVQAMALAEEAMKGVVAINVKLLLVVLVLGISVGGAGLAGFGGMAYQTQSGQEKKAQSPPIPGFSGDLQQKKPWPSLLDQYGDSLPAGAVARLGTLRFRHEGNVDPRSLLFAPDGKFLIANTAEGILLWDTATGKQIRRFPAGPLFTSSIDISPDGKFLAITHPEMVVLDIATGKKIFNVGREFAFIAPDATRFSPDGRTLAVQYSKFSQPNVKNREYGLLLVDCPSGDIRSKVNQPSSLAGLVFSPDGKTLAGAIGSRFDGSILLIDASSGKRLRTISVEADQAKAWISLAFSPDGRMLARGTSQGAGAVRSGKRQTSRQVRIQSTYHVQPGL